MSDVLITPKKQNKAQTSLSDTLIFSGNIKQNKVQPRLSDNLIFLENIKESLEHVLITPSESDGLLFPGELLEEKSHTLISPIAPSYSYDYLKVDNALSEFNSEELKAKARENLGVDDLITWGEIQGSLDDQTDLKQYLKDVIEDSTSTWIDVIN